MEERERQAARERTKEKGSRSTAEQTKRPRLDQPPPSNLDADDPVDDDDDDDSDERCVGCLYFFLPIECKIYFVIIEKRVCMQSRNKCSLVWHLLKLSTWNMMSNGYRNFSFCSEIFYLTL